MSNNRRSRTDQSDQGSNFVENNTLFNLLQMHPYEYLTQLNKIFNQYAKSANKSYSEVSKIKLPWKQFNQIKIPKYFEEMYVQTMNFNDKKKVQDESEMDEHERKFWRDHQEFVKKLLERRKEQKKQKQETKAQYFQKKRPNTAKENNCPISNTNAFLKKIIEKGGNLNYDREELKQQVLKKLSSINENSSKPSHASRFTQNKKPSRNIQSAKHSILKTLNKREFANKNSYSSAKYSTAGSKINITRPNLKKGSQHHFIAQLDKQECINQDMELSEEKNRHKIDENDFLTYNTAEEILNEYKNKICQVDCSISNYNVKKTISLLASLQELASALK